MRDVRTWPGRAALSLERRALWLAFAIVTLVSAYALVNASLVVDGTRYFWLDDDQMVSMRYARNLARGEGPVWNPGERVEGYTSLGWMLAMAGVHLLPLSDAATSLAVKILSWLLACVVVLLTDRLLQVLLPRPGPARPVVLLTLALCLDLLFWSTNGFETPLVTVTFLVGLLRVLRDVEQGVARASTALAIGLLPVARSDAFHLSGVLVAIGLALHADRRRFLKVVVLASVVPVGHLLFRRAYYGEWLPNTYFLKVADMPGLFWSGVGYLKSFVEAYAAPIVLVLAYTVWGHDRRVRWIAAAGALTGVHILLVGSDIYWHFRFLAPWVPVLLVLGACAAMNLAQLAPRAGQVLLLVMMATVVVSSGIHGRQSLRLRSENGVPEHGLVAGLMIRQFSAPEATVAVIAAGSVPYFSGRRSLDILGKTDARIAHLKPSPEARIGHSKYDIDYTLSQQPDLLVTLGPAEIRRTNPNTVFGAIEANQQFLANYEKQPIPSDYLTARGPIYVRQSSAEAQRMARWHDLRLGR